MNNEQVFVGKNDDLKVFSLDGNSNTCQEHKMSTSLLTIQNGNAISSICKGLAIYARKILF